VNGLKQLFSRRRLYRDLSEEMREHIEEKIEELIATGISRKEATAAARREFGNVTLIEQDSREIWRWPSLESFLADIRYGFRVLGRNPGFTTVAVLTLALGVGANAAIFGLVDAALLRAFPFKEPQRLVHVWTTDTDGDLHTPSPAEYLALRKDSGALEQIAGVGWADFFYTGDGSDSRSWPGLLVTANWLPTLGVQPFLGRNFLDEEQLAGEDAAVMLSYGCWRIRFHGDPRIVGRQIVLNRRVVTVVGVLPRSLAFYYENIEIFAPLVLDSYSSHGKPRAGSVRVQIVARLKPGVTLVQARSETEVIAERLRSPGAPADASGRLVVEDFAEEFRHPGPTRQNARRGLWIMAGAAGVVLLIACANVASLLLARGVKRHREVAVRAALGCSRGRMIRQLLTESTLLFVCGGTLGVFVARWSEELISKAAAGMVPNGTFLEVDARVFAVSLAISLGSALFFGMIPALSATRVNVNDHLKDAAQSAAGVSRSRRSRNLLVASQIALGMVLLVGFGLLLRSLRRVESAPLGYDPRNVLTATVTPSGRRYADRAGRARLMRNAFAVARSIPGVESVGAVDSLPMEGAESARLRIEPRSPKGAPAEEEIWYLMVSPEYFSTLKTPMVAGRSFRDSDNPESSPVAIINQTFARQYFPNASPIGYHVSFSDSPTAWREIVGVVSDFRQRNPEEDARALAYFPFAQTLPGGAWSLAVRVRAPSDMINIARRLSNQLAAVDPELDWQLDSMQQQIQDSESLTLRRPLITLLASFGSLALILAIVGVFGVTSYSVSERTREIGIRVALGAARREVAKLVLRETIAVTFAGLAMGTLGAFALTRFFPTGPIGWSGSGIYLYGVSRTDALTYTFAAVLLTTVATAAAWVPAQRAMRVDPLVALRYE
jgi:predicted permease